MFRERLKAIRKAKKITQDEIAAHLGIKRQTYSAYERGISIPDSLTLNKIATYFDVSTDSFFSDDDKSDTFALNQEEKQLLLLARKAEKLPRTKRQKLISNFEENIDLYLDALGLKKYDKDKLD